MWALSRFILAGIVLTIGVQLGMAHQRDLTTAWNKAQIQAMIERIQARAARYGRTIDPEFAAILAERPLIAAVCEAESQYHTCLPTGPAGEKGAPSG